MPDASEYLSMTIATASTFMPQSDLLTMTVAERRSPDKPLASLSLPLAMAGAYLLMVMVGVVVLRLPGATVRGNEMSFERAVFTAVNAGTLTGFQQAVALDDYAPRGQACVMTLMCGGVLFTLLIGG